MKSSVLITALCVAGSLAAEQISPPNEVVVTAKKVVVVTTTVTTTIPCPTVIPTTSYKPEPTSKPPVIPPVPTSSAEPLPPPPVEPSTIPCPEPGTSTYAPPPPPPPTSAPAPPAPAPPPPSSAPAPPAPPPSQPSQGPAPPPPPPGKDYKEQTDYHHNVHRSNHSAPALTWSTALENSARKLAETCIYGHDTSIDGGGYGQNIGYQSGYNSVASLLTQQMYNEEVVLFEGNYGNNNPSNFHAWGHFTQMVWISTTHYACYTAHCSNLGGQGSGGDAYYTVCNYSPPGMYTFNSIPPHVRSTMLTIYRIGNVLGQYAANVKPPKGQPIVTV
ncbi:SCP-like extracellular protein, putative [Trichophyton verrucosum HKI 0517]|uniref:SCP-like extracellular protein, putative n=1 Tax=Trichophyton verrucosum (strain HKI 0517) TaxID=663202 RepID=D4DEI8_TRIVH|nr:SCP-like extracellular protein, putative [Trichophyton verrucosum HKI 0517]EFE39744.1 SCP-like extracellular protein, putative [Trichophyton verrucosum HKI 0517]